MEATRNQWQAAFFILLIVLVFWLVPVFVVSLLRVSHKRDPARKCFVWLKLSLFFMTVGVVLLLADGIPSSLGTAFGLAIDDSLDVSLHQCKTVGYLFYQVAFVLALPMLLEAVLAVLYDWDLIESSFPMVQTIAYSFVGIEIVFAVVVFIFVEINSLGYAALSGSQPGAALPYVRLLAAFDVLLWMASLGMTFYSAFLVVLARRRPTHQKATRFLLAASVLWLSRNSWGIAADATWMLAGAPRPGTYDAVLEALFSYWAQFLCLGLLCLLGRKKTSSGLWTAPRYPTYSNSPYQDQLTRPMVAAYVAGAGASSEPYDGFSRPPVYLDRAQGALTTSPPPPLRPDSSLASPAWPLPPLPEVGSPGGKKGGAGGGGGSSNPLLAMRGSDSDDRSRAGRSVCRSASQSSLLEAYRNANRCPPSAVRAIESTTARTNLRRHESLDRFLEQNQLRVTLANEAYTAPKRI